MSSRLVAARTGLPAGAVSSTRTTGIVSGWRLTSTEPGAIASPAELSDDPREWAPAIVPGTVAKSMGPNDLDAHQEYDARDWWYRCGFEIREDEIPAGAPVRLRFDGLATLAEVWLNGERILESRNMFTVAIVDVTGLVRDSNELSIVFRSLHRALEQKRPRPRWKTKLVERQQLRWHRTTLLGRIPGWTPRIQPVGPWRPVWLEVAAGPDVTRLDVRPGIEGPTGVVRVDAETRARHAGARVTGATLRVGDRSTELEVEGPPDATRIHGELRLPEVALWWPLTHGTPALHSSQLTLHTSDGAVSIALDPIGFRDVRVDASGENVRFLVNGLPVFCRGACWTSNDIVSLTGPEDRMLRTLELVADAHANMLRVGGTMVYECDAFYRACDALGIMVWQDLMFANMDYPADDPDFRAEAEQEIEQQLRRLQRHPCVVAVAGGSEIEQQAAMFGAPREIWSNEFFANTVPRLVSDVLGEATPYWSSTPTGGAMPFHVGAGIAHYFGVGAYLRPLDDARSAGVRFSPECLGFSNLPEPSNLTPFQDASRGPLGHAAWKGGVPRDSGTNWDFEDVRDHYLHLLFGVDASHLREHDPGRYLTLARVITGRVMAAVFDEWRSRENPCSGALVWFLQDLRPGAGWGIIDSDARPKPVYAYLKRAWAPVRVTLLDRGLDGLRAEVHNETPAPLEGELEVTVYAPNSALTARASKRLRVERHDSTSESVEAVVGHFTDSTYAYRFGPLAHAAVVARFRPDGGDDEVAVRWSSLDTPLGPAEVAISLNVFGDHAELTLESSKLIRDLRIDCPGWSPTDNYLDLLPSRAAKVRLTGRAGAVVRGCVEAPNIPAADFSSSGRP